MAHILPPLRKIIFELNRWLANSPTHINQYFSGLKEASIRRESLFIEKKHFIPRLTAPPCICPSRVIRYNVSVYSKLTSFDNLKKNNYIFASPKYIVFEHFIGNIVFTYEVWELQLSRFLVNFKSYLFWPSKVKFYYIKGAVTRIKVAKTSIVWYVFL